MSLPDPAPSIVVGSQAIALAGTAEQLTSVAIRPGHTVILKARHTNTGYCYPASTALLAQAHHFGMGPDVAVELDIDNLDRIYVDVSVSGDYVEWLVEGR